MGKGKVMGVCPMCAYLNDTDEKELHDSHVVPRSVFKNQYRNNGAKLGNRLIEMSYKAETPLEVTQDQGKEPMLCFACEQRLSGEIEKPTLEWLRRQSQGRSVQADSVLLARYVASVWWRAMWSKHRFYEHILFDHKFIRPIIEASLDPHATLTNVSFRLRKLQDSSGGSTLAALEGFQAIMTNHLPDEKLVQGHSCFALIHEGYIWEVFSPRLSRSTMGKLDCFKADRSRYLLRTYDLFREPAFLEHATLQLSKHLENGKTPAFQKVFGRIQE